MRYFSRWKLARSALFGLPDTDTTVIPADGRPLRSGILDVRFGTLISHGTLSCYREQDQTLKAQLVIGEITAELTDNFVVMSMDAPEPQFAYCAMESTVQDLCRGLTVHYHRVFSAELLSVTDESDSRIDLANRRQVPILRGVTYHIPSLHEHVTVVAGWCSKADARSRKALLYFEHACSLRDLASRHSHDTEPLGVNITEAAQALGVSRKTLSSILDGRAGICQEMAVRLSIAFDITAESWLHQQTQFDLWHAGQSRNNLRVTRLAA